MIYLYFMSLFLLTMYIMYAVRVCGVSWSLSDTYYQLKKRNRPAWLFQAAMVVPAMLLIPVWIDCSNESFQFLAFLACGGLMWVLSPRGWPQFSGYVLPGCGICRPLHSRLPDFSY